MRKLILDKWFKAIQQNKKIEKTSQCETAERVGMGDRSKSYNLFIRMEKINKNRYAGNSADLGASAEEFNLFVEHLHSIIRNDPSIMLPVTLFLHSTPTLACLSVAFLHCRSKA